MKTKIVISPSNTKALEFLRHIQAKKEETKARMRKRHEEILAMLKKN